MSAHPTMAQWLDLHGVTAHACRTLLQTAPPVPRVPAAPRRTATGLDGPALWAQTCAALLGQLPDLAAEISCTARDTVTVFNPDPAKYPPAFTIRRDNGDPPVVACRIAGTALDVLTLAHEFGHALNYVAAGDVDPPPVLRETCAFVCETLVLRGLDPALATPAGALRARHGARYMAAPRDALLAALDAPATPYDYGWNYPPARLLADALTGPAHGALWPDLLRGRLSLARLIAAV